MVKAFAAIGEETIDEAPRPRALDELDLEVADGEVGPEEFRRIPIAFFPGAIQSRGKMLEEKGERLIDRTYGDRHVVDAKPRQNHRRKLREQGDRVNSWSRLDFRA